MSNQKFNASQREALWLVHEKKCAYTRELLDVSCFQIDHIIPESLADKPLEFEQVRTDFELDKDFDIFGYENLLPCRISANLQKGSLVFDKAHTHYFLSIAASKKSEVLSQLEKIEKRNNRGKVLILLRQCLERGELSISEIVNILEVNNEQPQEIFRLIESMKFADAVEILSIAKADIDELRGKPLKLGQNDHVDGVTLTNDSDEKVYVRTCKEYDEAIQTGYYALSNYDIKMSAFFEHQCGLLNSLQIAKTPERSFIDNPKAGIIDLHLIPFSFFPSFEEEPQENDAIATYQSKVDDGTLVIKKIRQNTIRVEEPEGMGQQLIEVARADFNCDSIEDILLFEYCYATHGSLGYGSIRILTRKSENGLFDIVS